MYKRSISICLSGFLLIGFTQVSFALPSLKDLPDIKPLTENLPHPGKKSVSVSNDEAIQALREALKTGINAAVKILAKPDGYFGDALVKILMPPEAKSLLDNVGRIPQGQKLIDDVVLRLNRSAEEAAGEVVPIFVNAITSMTVADGIEILKGSDTAATAYLQSKTRAALFKLVKPKVDTALSKPLVGKKSAKEAWNILIGAYNKAGQVVNPAAKLVGKSEPMPAITVDLPTYATDKALDGLFLKMADEEKKIRKNPLGYAVKIIQKVFGALKDGLL